MVKANKENGTVDFSDVLKNEAGEDLKIRDKEQTLGIIVANALFATFPDEKDLSGEEKFKRGMLALDVQGAGTMTLSAEDIAMIKKVVAKAYGPLIVAQSWKLLDPACR